MERYQPFFRTKTRSCGDVAKRYLQGLTQAHTANFETMASVVEGGCAQQFQHFISNSPWDYKPVVDQIGQDADRLLGGKSDSCLIIDETSFIKQGKHSVGVARQWSGRLGKVDNCQVAVFCAMSDGHRHVPIDMRLYLPKAWVEDPARCTEAGVPPAECRTVTTKSQHALAMVRSARARGLRFGWTGLDAGYGKEGWLLRTLDDEGEIFVADVHKDQKMWINDPELHIPPRQGTRGRAPTKCQTAEASVEVQAYVKSLGAQAWTRVTLRDSTRGPLQVEIIRRRVYLWDGKENKARCWHLIVRREINSPETIKYSLCNAPADTPLLRLAQMQGLRYWVERVFQDAKGECGLADYQVLSWLAWHHHVTMVMLAMLFIAEQRQTGNPELELLTPRDIVEILIETLPRKPEGKQALVDRINLRHRRRQSAIDSRFRCKENEINQLRIVDS